MQYLSFGSNSGLPLRYDAKWICSCILCNVFVFMLLNGKEICILQGMDDPSFVPMWQFNSFGELSTASVADSFEGNLHHSFAHQMFDVKPCPETPHTGASRPLKIQKTNSWDSSITDLGSNPPANSSPNLVSFSNSSNYANQFGILKPKEDTQDSFGNQNYVLKASQGAKRISTNTRFPSNQDHVMAERKRREKLSQRFIALSAIIPGLKKVLV